MMHRQACPALLAAALSLSAAACTDDAADDAVFSDLDAAHLERTLDVVGLGDLGIVLFESQVSAGHTATDCPIIATSGEVTTITGGCTTSAGTRFDGTWTITNFAGTPAHNPSRPGTVVIDDYRKTITGRPVDRIDGMLTVAPDGTISGDISQTLDGIDSHSVMAFACAGDLCTVAADSRFTVEDVGSATVTGQFRRGQDGDVTAHGAETLVIDVATTTDVCVHYSIEGVAGVSGDDCGDAR